MNGLLVHVGRRLPALRAREYRRYLGAVFATNVALFFDGIAIGWWTLQRTGSPLMVGLLAFFASIPNLFLTPVAGVLNDRVDERRLLRWILGLHVAVGAATVAAVRWLPDPVQWVAALSLLKGVATAFRVPAQQSSVRHYAPREDLPSAIAVSNLQFNTARTFAPALAGWMLAQLGVPLTLTVPPLLFVLSLALYARLPPAPPPPTRRRKRSAWVDLRLGLRYVRRQREIRSMLLLALGLSLFCAPFLQMAPVVVRDLLHAQAEVVGALASSWGIGAMVGMLSVTLAAPAERRKVVLFASATLPLLLLGVASSSSTPLTLLLVAGMGAAMATSLSLTNTLVQQRSRPAMQGRVVSFFVLCTLGFIPIGNLIAGALAQRAGVSGGLSYSALALAALVLGAWMSSPRGSRPSSAPGNER